MGFWKGAALLAGGAIAGYLASRSKENISKQELVLGEKSSLERLTGGEAAVAKFFDSPIGKPLAPLAQKALAFAATVKSGMDEKEAELQTRFEQQKQDLRPGSIDTWSQPLRNQTSLLQDKSEEKIIEVESTQEVREKLNQRIARDKELGEDFFA